jgi:hypothetical protein
MRHGALTDAAARLGGRFQRVRRLGGHWELWYERPLCDGDRGTFVWQRTDPNACAAPWPFDIDLKLIRCEDYCS